MPREADSNWPAATKKYHADWWCARIARQQEIDKSIATARPSPNTSSTGHMRKREQYEWPALSPSRVLSPHRVLGVDADDELDD